MDLLLLFGGYATVFLVSPKRNNAGSNGMGGIDGAMPGSRGRLTGQSKSKVWNSVSLSHGRCCFCWWMLMLSLLWSFVLLRSSLFFPSPFLSYAVVLRPTMKYCVFAQQ